MVLAAAGNATAAPSADSPCPLVASWAVDELEEEELSGAAAASWPVAPRPRLESAGWAGRCHWEPVHRGHEKKALLVVARTVLWQRCGAGPASAHPAALHRPGRRRAACTRDGGWDPASHVAVVVAAWELTGGWPKRPAPLQLCHWAVALAKLASLPRSTPPTRSPRPPASAANWQCASSPESDGGRRTPDAEASDEGGALCPVSKASDIAAFGSAARPTSAPSELMKITVHCSECAHHEFAPTFAPQSRKAETQVATPGAPSCEVGWWMGASA